MLHRENAVSNSYQAKFLTDRFLNFADFRGSHVIVHNNIMKRIFVETKYIESQHIFVVRMDRYLKKIAAGVTEAKKTEFVYFRLAFLNLPPHWPKDLNTSPEKYFTELSYQTHNTIINYAKTHQRGGRNKAKIGRFKQIDILSKHDIYKGQFEQFNS